MIGGGPLAASIAFYFVRLQMHNLTLHPFILGDVPNELQLIALAASIFICFLILMLFHILDCKIFWGIICTYPL